MCVGHQVGRRPELTRFDRAQAYWTGLGWAERAPIKTESRIDVPREGQQMPAGPTTFGGVAWAQTRGVRAVEVLIDNRDWRAADLGANYSKRHLAVMELSMGRHPRIAHDHRAGHRQHRHCAGLRGGRRNSRRRHRLALGVIEGVLTARSEPKAAFGQATQNRPPNCT